jgi:hypothetical protein
MKVSKYCPSRLLFESRNFNYKRHIKIAFWDITPCNLVDRHFYASLHIRKDIFLATVVRTSNLTNTVHRTVKFIGWNMWYMVLWNLWKEISDTRYCGI